MPVKKSKTFIRKTTEKSGISAKPVVNEKEVVTEEIETTEQEGIPEKSVELDTKEADVEVKDQMASSKSEENMSEKENGSSKDEANVESGNEGKYVLGSEDEEASNDEDPSSRLEKIAEEQVEDEVSNTSKNKFLWGVLPVVLIAGVIIGGIFVYNLGVKNGISQATKIAPTASPSQNITPTEVPVALDEFSIDVLNGSGVGGEAAKVDDLLTSAGFDVSSTGNADSSDYSQTVIQVKEKVPEPYVKKLMEELEKTYELDKTEILDDSETTDVIVIVGSSTIE